MWLALDRWKIGHGWLISGRWMGVGWIWYHIVNMLDRIWWMHSWCRCWINGNFRFFVGVDCWGLGNKGDVPNGCNLDLIMNLKSFIILKLNLVNNFVQSPPQRLTIDMGSPVLRLLKFDQFVLFWVVWDLVVCGICLWCPCCFCWILCMTQFLKLVLCWWSTLYRLKEFNFQWL